MHDSVELERRGVPTVMLVTEPFRSLASGRATFLGMSALALVPVQHPLAHVDEDGIAARADTIVDAVAAGLTGRSSP